MNEIQRTSFYAGAAAVLLAAALLTAPSLPAALSSTDVGQPFYPDFKDPLRATSLEITRFNEGVANVTSFKVELKQGRWVISSRDDHPADAKDRLAKSAAAMMDLRKEAFVTENPGDHELYGVIDPQDLLSGAVNSLSGGGARVTLRDGEGRLLCDLVLGKSVKGREGRKYARVPGQKRVYETTITQELSTEFMDWVERDLLLTERSKIRKIVLDRYTLQDRRFLGEDTITLSRPGTGDWSIDNLRADQQVDQERVGEVLGALDDLRIVDVTRKPPGLAAKFMSDSAHLPLAQRDLGSLVDRGFWPIQRVEGVLDLVGEGCEMRVETSEGVVYRLWFGQPLADSQDEKSKDSRYLVIRTLFDESLVPVPDPPKDTKDDGSAKTDEEKKRDQEDYDRRVKERSEKLTVARKQERELAERFGDWYYVIPGEDYRKLMKSRADFLKTSEPPKPPEEHKPEDGHQHDPPQDPPKNP